MQPPLNEELNNERLRNYLLGDVSEEERASFEVRFFSDEESADQAFVAEEEFIEEYLRNELSPENRKRFEAAYLTQPRRRERVLAMKAVMAAATAEGESLAESPTPSFWASIAAFFSFENVFARYALAAVVLLVLVFGGWFLFRRLGRETEPQLARQGEPPIQVESPPPSSSPLPSPGVSPARQPSPSPSAVKEAGPTFTTIVLSPSLVRDPAAANKLTIAPSVRQVRLQLGLERNDYQSYLVRVTTVDGKTVWESKRATVQPGSAGNSISVSIPANLLPTNDYLVELTGVDKAGRRESVASYFFTVSKD